MWGRQGRVALRAAVLVLAAWPAAPASAQSPQPSGFLAGAGVADITPPKPGTPGIDATYAPEFANCPAPVFPNEGRFALQEPFNDQNGNGQWDPNVSFGGAPTGAPEPYCDVNGNGHWDGIYADNNKGPATGVHDPIGVRAIAISDGHDRPVVYASVSVIGIFDYYTDAARALLASKYKVDADLVVTANHNESSPDTIGLYGALTTPANASVRSGIDDYYMGLVEDRIAQAAAAAVHNLEPATLYASQVEGPIPPGLGQVTANDRQEEYPLLTGMSQRVSDQFPTSVANPTSDPGYSQHDDRVAAVDPKMGVLQARRPDGTPIFTAMSLSAHNQEMGNSSADFSGDWPAAFQGAFDAAVPGLAVFLVADNGSIEDPRTDPPAIPGGSENHSSASTQFVQVQATGQRFAQIAAAAAQTAQPLTPGAVKLTRQQFCVPLENNGFVALGAAGVFGRRQGYVCDPSGNPVQPAPTGFALPNSGTQFRTFVGVADVGPDLQLIDNPGESFPALMLGSPFTKADESCDRPNPAVPVWHSNRLFRFQVGLADDLIGYLIPPWGFASGVPGLFNNDSCSSDMAGHRHKLESESVGPTGSGDVANRLSALLGAEKDPSAQIPTGRFVLADGSFNTWSTGAVAILLPPAGSNALDPNGGTLIGAPGATGFGGRAVDATGAFMDYDGQPQSAPDVTTRGMMTFDSRGCVSGRYYLDVFETLALPPKLGAAQTSTAGAPSVNCPVPNLGGVPEVQSALQRELASGGFAAVGGRPGARILPASATGCAGGSPPRSTIRGRGPRRTRRLTIRHGRLRLRGRSQARGCAGRPGTVARVTVAVWRASHRRCRFVTPAGGLTAPRDCARPLLLLARGTTRWSLRLRLRVPRGRYRLAVRAVDGAGNVERAGGRAGNVVRLRVR